jgi:PleD family two-component response regulator
MRHGDCARWTTRATDPNGFDHLVERADKAMYFAGAAGRDKVGVDE